jgi:hypothetical protein
MREIYVVNRLLTVPLPFNTLLHTAYRTGTALLAHPQPLVRIGENHVNLG